MIRLTAAWTGTSIVVGATTAYAQAHAHGSVDAFRNRQLFLFTPEFRCFHAEDEDRMTASRMVDTVQ